MMTRAFRALLYLLLLPPLVWMPANAVAEGPDSPPHDDATETGGPVIPPGQEELLGEMLGKDATLPGPCSLDAGEVVRTVIKGTYKCPGGNVVVELHHPSAAPKNATRTNQFALVVASGAAPAGLESDLAQRIRAKEDKFVWKILDPPARAAGSSRGGVMLLSLGVVGAGVLTWALLRRRAPN